MGLLKDTWKVGTPAAVPQSFVALHISVHTVLITRGDLYAMTTISPLTRTRKARLLSSHFQ